ncbi:MAG TPA: hypothetical protein VJM09_05165 [Sphingobium sp.]|nr:hypothetical protein [Sphingobium sp.]
MNARPLQIGDVVTRTGVERLRVIALYDGCDEIIVETIVGAEWTYVGEKFDLLEFDVELVEQQS